MDVINYYYDKMEEISDPVTKDFFLCDSLYWGFAIIVFYLYFTLSLGPKLMANREPFKLERVIQAYNLLQIISCSFLMCQALRIAWLKDYALFCEPIPTEVTPQKILIATYVWYFYLLKIFDLFDTVFFVLRKKNDQVSFLHVYHHAGMVLGGFAATRFFPGGHGTFLGPVNCFVHIIMYTYYLAASLKMNVQWCKKHITQLQLLQFCILLCHYFALLLKKDCAYPRWSGYVMVPQNLFMILLFGEFYYKTYIKQSPKKAAGKDISADVPNGKAKTQ